MRLSDVLLNGNRCLRAPCERATCLFNDEVLNGNPRFPIVVKCQLELMALVQLLLAGPALRRPTHCRLMMENIRDVAGALADVASPHADPSHLCTIAPEQRAS